MFESSLIALEAKRRPRRRWLSLPLAIALHLIVLVSLAAAQYWNVEQVPEPQVNTVFFTQAALPPPPIARGTENPAPVATHPAAPIKPAQEVQPQDIPPTIPTPPLTDTSATVDPSLFDPTAPITGTGPKGDPSGDIHGSPIGEIGGPGTIPADDAPIPVGGEVLRPEIIHRVQPQYTELARKTRLQGTVIVQAVIDEQGRVVDIKVLKKLGMGLDQEAVDAVGQWRFKPATFRGKAVKVYYSLTVNFQVQ